MSTDAERHRRLMELFDEACELERSAQQAFLSSVDDAALRTELAQMLEQDRRSEVFFDAASTPGMELLADDILRSGLARHGIAEPDEMPERIGEYAIVRRIGAGAMGTVYEAEQAVPQRRVALKALHPFLVSLRARERFRFEAQALAALEHAGIPRVHTVGEDRGVVYFAMDLVRGETLTEHAAHAGLGDRARIELVCEVADAVHHAHLRGFVHRDLKPDNVRIAQDGHPRVLDFGIAAALRIAPASSAEVEIAGTLSYMAPEQLDPRARIDGRADVYAIGVILFELLAGQAPRQLAGLAFDEAVRRITEDPLPALSSIDRRFAGDLDAIVARATARDPAHRYASAAELAEDLRRALRGEPVEARPPTLAYLGARFVRRHRGVTLALALTVLAIVSGATISAAQWLRAERLRAEEARQRVQADDARARAELEAARAAATVEFFDRLLTEADPDRALGREVTVRDALERAAARLERGELATQPEVERAVRTTLAETFHALGEEARAGEQIDRAIALAGPEDDLLARALLLRAELDFGAGRLDRAEAAASRAERAASLPALDSDAIHLQAIVMRESGRLGPARARFEEALGLRQALSAHGALPIDELTATMNQYAYALALGGDYDAAEPLYLRALALDERQHGPDHPEVATDLHHVAWFEHQRGRDEAALARLDRAERIRRSTLGDRHPRLGNQQTLRASALLALGRTAEARLALEEGLAILAAIYPAGDPLVQRPRATEVRLRLAEGDAAGALALAREIEASVAARYGEGHWMVAEVRVVLALALIASGQEAEGRAEARRAAGDLERALGPGGHSTREARALAGD